MSSWREQLAFAPLEIAERGEEIGERLRHAIELGVLEDGTQLPSESDLAGMMRVSTQTLRTALAELRHLGLVETRRGRGGGSFVKANNGDSLRVRTETLASYSLEDLRDLREYRAALTGSAAAAAAERSQQIPLGRLESLAGIVETAGQPADMMRADIRFHIELAAAARSVRLTRQELALQADVGPLIWSSAPGGGREAAQEHEAIVEAIRAGDADRARAHAEEHVRHDMNRLIDLRMSLDTASSSGAPPTANEIDSAVSSIKALTGKIQQTAVTSLQIVEDTVRALLDGAPSGRPGALDELYAAARRTLEEASPTLIGLGFFITDPSFFGQSGFAWFYKPSDRQAPQRVSQDLQYYDPSATAWWPPDGAKGIHSSYAYVDANGHNYIIDFSKRVTADDGRLIGVAGADILISHLQTVFAPLMASLPQGSCIVDQNGVVITTNSGSLVGGTLSPDVPRRRRIPLPNVTWSLYLGDAERTR
ncbi:FCD domain-containing protein [Sinomonas humi]|uniref:FCD domain-containing protein n=1 Tax=Sinomonas humi TaxID=1338436 RepID=UPI00068F5560|nr:FCD domain-containing protein [Sinomonas humi]